MLEGEVELNVEGTFSVTGPGSSVYLPRGTLHTFTNAGDAPAKFLAPISPASFEGFFEEVGEPAADSAAPPAGPPDVEKVMALAPKYGLEIPPPSSP